MSRNALTRRFAEPVLTHQRSGLLSPDPWEDFFNESGLFSRPWAPLAAFAGQPWPAADVLQTNEAWIIHLDLPGLTKKDVSVSLEENRLTIVGERTAPEGIEATRSERCYGSFQRTFTLPNTASTKEVHASFRDGVLTVTVPKAETARSRQIQIN